MTSLKDPGSGFNTNRQMLNGKTKANIHFTLGRKQKTC